MRAIMLVLAALLAGCASLPARDFQRPSVALQETAGSPLAEVADRSLPPGENGFKLLPEPGAALEARIALIDRAQRTLDLQYFIWHADVSGRLVLGALRDAALRGVRVRLLLDDLYSAEVDGLLDGLSGFPGIEVRLFNPFPSGRASLVGRVAGSLGDLRRIRHRMHNKLLVADNTVAIAGGRNIGDPYFSPGDGSYFDVDILAMGPIVREMSESFDDYWNSDHAFAGGLLWGESPAATRQARFAELMVEMSADAPRARLASARVPRPGIAGELTSGTVALQVCKARMFADPVEKVSGVSLHDSSATLHERLVHIFVQARQDLYVVSPYFVRGQKGLQRIKGLRDRGVRLRLLTNSGSSTDEFLAHVVYKRYRKPLMQAGVEIREYLPARRVARKGDSPEVSASRLHAKLAIVDHRFVYVGSLNFTGRSERINTELGLILDCPALASQLMQLIESVPAYQLRLAQNSVGIEWVDRGEEPARIWDVDPEVTLWQNIKSIVLGQLVPEEEI